MSTPRPEYPRPQFERETWKNLNGVWTYAFDFGKSGGEQGYARSKGFPNEILVPFCPESRLSGVEHTDFIEAMWYHRALDIPADWQDRRILLNLGGVDYESDFFIDGRLVERHWGGTSSFTLDITRFVTPGKRSDLVVHVRDNVRSGRQPSGKQSSKLRSAGCHYTRTTGIWQTVWLEAVPPCSLAAVHIIPDLDGGRFVVIPSFRGLRTGTHWTVSAWRDQEKVAETRRPAANGVPCVVKLPESRAWSPEDPFLYDLVFEVSCGDGVTDRVKSYAGLRKIHIEGNRVFLNNRPLYQRLVLDQGFYPDGIWTAPSDEALRRDIELSLRAGFNGARLHQKVFEERFHYWADRLGYLTWGESSSWGLTLNDELSARNFLSEWREIVVRDRNHPSVITWSPFNETRGHSDSPVHRRLHLDAYELTHALDPTRPVNDASGYVHVKTDVYTVHTYQQDARKLKDTLTPDPEKGPWRNVPEADAPYEGQPYIVDEFGGIKWIPGERAPFAEDSWGYGDAPAGIEEFYQRLESLVRAIASFDHISGFCYTQLTDVEQEQNGIYNYDRSEKFDMARIARALRGAGAAER